MLREAISSYIAMRRAVGFQLQVQEGLLYNFARYAEEHSQTFVERHTAIDWAAKAPSPHQRENRLGTVRRFARHVHAEDSRHDLIPRHVFASQRRHRSFPYLLSDAQLQQLLEATARLRPRGFLRPHTCHTLFALLAVTGLRISEAMRLLLSDVTPDGLVIRRTKFRKSRLVPLHPSAQDALERYFSRRRIYACDSDHVFISNEGRALSYAMINGTFHFLLRSIDLRWPPGVPPPRIHDLRHRFAVRALESYVGDRAGIERHVLALSTYLGHAHVTDTYWYLQTTPHLMRSVADAREAWAGGEGDAS